MFLDIHGKVVGTADEIATLVDEFMKSQK